MESWALDYVELMGDPAADEVWESLTGLLNSAIEREDGVWMHVEATAIDAGGHRTEAVKAYVRSRKIRRPMAIFGAVANTAPVLSKPKAQDVNWKGIVDRKGVMIYHVGTVAVKHMLYGRLSTDADKEPERRLCHFSDEMPKDYFAGLVSESFNPGKNRFEKKRGARNEPLDTYVYSYAATHHPELRLHRHTRMDWDKRAATLNARRDRAPDPTPVSVPAAVIAQQPAPMRRRGAFKSRDPWRGF